MHKDDQMTSNERLTAYFEGKEVDRLPAMPMIDSFGCKLSGKPMRYKRQSAEHQVEIQKAAYDILGLDGLSIEYGLHGIGVACGTTLTDPENATPAIAKHCMEDISEIDNFDPECVRRKNDPWMNMCCTACEMLVDQMGDEVGTSAALTGPLTILSSMMPITKLLKAMRKQPDAVMHALRFATDALKIICDEFAATGVDIFICDPLSSSDIIRPEEYEKMILPFTQELAPVIHKHEVAMGYHICGNTNPILPLQAQTGCDMLSVDAKVPLTYLKEVAGDKMPLIGNIDPIGVMMMGTPADVRENVLKAIHDAGDSPNGLLVATGCDIPVTANVENALAFMDAVREFGPVRLGMEMK